MSQQEQVFVYCDNGRHRGRHAPVTNFYRYRDKWSENPNAFLLMSGMNIVNNNELPTPQNPIMAAVDARYGRLHYRLRLKCSRRHCPSDPVVAREEHLFAALNELATSGESAISLTDLAAKLGARR